MVGKKQSEKGDPPLIQKKEQKPESNCQTEKDVSHGLVVKKKAAGQGKPLGEKTELHCEAKKVEGTHKRDLSEIKSKPCHGDELRKPSASHQEKPIGESHHVQKESEPVREKETKPLPQVAPSQKPMNKPPGAGHLSKEQPKSWEARETKAKDAPSTQATQKRLQGHCPAQAEARPVPAPKAPAPQSAPQAAGPSLGARQESDTSSSDSEEDVIFVSSQPGYPSLSDRTSDSRKKENLQFPGHTGQRKMSPASGAPKKVEPSDPAAQRAYLTTQLKQKKVSAACALS